MDQVIDAHAGQKQTGDRFSDRSGDRQLPWMSKPKDHKGTGKGYKGKSRGGSEAVSHGDEPYAKRSRKVSPLKNPSLVPALTFIAS